MKKKRVALVVEDIRFIQFLEPAVEWVAHRAEVDVEWLPAASISGCRPAKLKELAERVRPTADLVVVGADADGRGHLTRGAGHKRKRKKLLELLGAQGPLSIAVAQPSVEAWLFCHPNGFAEGLTDALDYKFRKPARWPIPRGEAQAKEQLGRLIREGANTHLPRAGFEFAREIVRRVPLDSTDNASADGLGARPSPIADGGMTVLAERGRRCSARNRCRRGGCAMRRLRR